MNLNVKKIDENAVIPEYKTGGAAGMDLIAVSRRFDDDLGRIATYHTGLAFEIPVGYVGLLFPRSSIYSKGLRQCNAVGVIDSDYIGEVSIKYDIQNIVNEIYAIGDRIGQLLIIPTPHISIIEVDELSKTGRGAGAFGSTGV